MIKIIKTGKDQFSVEDWIESKDGPLFGFCVENLNQEQMLKFIEGRKVDDDSIAMALALVSFTNYPAVFDEQGKLKGVVEGNC